MDDWQAVKFIIMAYLILTVLSRPLQYVLGTCLTYGMSEFVTFLIVYLLDVAAIYAALKFTHIGGILETFWLAVVNAFPFALFYFLGVYMIYFIIKVVTDIINFILM